MSGFLKLIDNSFSFSHDVLRTREVKQCHFALIVGKK